MFLALWCDAVLYYILSYYTYASLYHTIDVHITEIILVKLIKLKANLIINNDYIQSLQLAIIHTSYGIRFNDSERKVSVYTSVCMYYWVHIDSMMHFLRCALLHLHIFILLILHYRFLRQFLGEHSPQRNRSNNRGRRLQPEIIACEPAWVRLVQQTRWTRHPQCLRWERSRGDACFLAAIGVHGSVCASPQ